MTEGTIPLSRLETELDQPESRLSQLEANLETGQSPVASPHDASLEEAKKKYLADVKAASRKGFRSAMIKVSSSSSCWGTVQI